MIRLQELELVFGQTHGRTHRRDVGNSILDVALKLAHKTKDFHRLDLHIWNFLMSMLTESTLFDDIRPRGFF